MDLSRQEYPALLTSLQPEQAINVLDDRVALINKINLDIADFLQERRKIEERYAAELRKLARRPHAENSSALGVFDMPWQRIVSGTENLAQSHETLASKIETDVEAPLKQYATKNREMQAITTIQGNLAAIAKDLTKAKEKADKAVAKGGRKADDANSNVGDAAREWESQSPFVFEQLQALDESRVNHLRDVLTQFQTHELDQLEKGRASAEGCLNALLNVETADEIKTFAAKVTQGRSSTMMRRGSSATADRPRSSVGNVPPAPPPPRHSDSRHNSAANPDRLASVPEATPDKKSKIGGLKRLGTVMRGKKGAAPPPPPQNTTEKKKEKTRGFAPFRRGDSSRSFQDLEETGRDLAPITSQPDRGGSSQGPSTIDQQPPPSRASGLAPPVELNGVSNTQRSPSNELPAPLVPTPAHTFQPPPPPAQPTQVYTPPAQQNSLYDDVTTPTSADRGYGSPTTEEPPRTNLTIRDEPIQEDASEAQLAMSNMANQLRMQAQNSGMSRPQSSVRGRRDVRNTIFVQSGTEVPGLSNSSTTGVQPTTPGSMNQPTSSSTSLPTASPIMSPSATRASIPALLEEHVAGSDANSVHSSQTLGTMVHHPELTQPGLNASIVETVSTWFSESGVTQSFVIGEIAFSHTTTPTVTPQEMETIRLQNFQALEKVAANPTFVTRHKSVGTSPEEQAGSYNIALSSIRRSSPTVGLKYQLHLSESHLARYSPILLTPAWQILEGQASVIVLYELNPDFPLSQAAAAAGELSLKNVAISVSLNVKDFDSGRATNAMMSPTQGASFRRKASTVVWRFPDLKLKAGKERLLVRFMTEGSMAKKGSIELNFEAPEVTAGGLAIERTSASSSAESDPFADEAEARKSGEGAPGTWEELPTRRMLISGRYSAV